MEQTKPRFQPDHEGLTYDLAQFARAGKTNDVLEMFVELAEFALRTYSGKNLKAALALTAKGSDFAYQLKCDDEDAALAKLRELDDGV